MDNTLMMPKNYNLIAQEEMVYTCGGANLINNVFSALGVPSLIIGAVSIADLIWGVSSTRSWLQENKKSSGNTAKDVADTAVEGIDDVIAYASKSVWHSVVAVYTGMNLATWWPVTALAWLTA